MDAAVRAVGAARERVVRDVGAVQAGAAALDLADAACSRGDGVPARAALRRASAPADRAAAALRVLPGELTAYERALTALEGARRSAPPPAARALSDVTSTGQAEVSAAQGFRDVAASLWPTYARLADDEATWVRRAVTPWYRSTREGADAYAVLVSDRRPALERARTRLAGAASSLQSAMLRQQQVLAATNRVLGSS